MCRGGRLSLTNWWSFVEVWDQDKERARNDFHCTGAHLPGLCINPCLSLCYTWTQRKHDFTSVWNMIWACSLFYTKIMSNQHMAVQSDGAGAPTQTTPIGRHDVCVMTKRLEEYKHNTSLGLSSKKAELSNTWFIFSQMHWSSTLSADSVVRGRAGAITVG